ncbi:MAG: MaoC/PaaZ C-terminal domain-containing protein [Desulfosalsimonas sp.]
MPKDYHMKLSPEFAGTPLRPHQTLVRWRDTKNYAAATGDNNPLYFDDQRQQGILAPPMFCVALTWPVSENLGENILAENFPEEHLRTMVHYTEHLEIHRPLRPGDSLVINGAIAAIRSHWTGTHVIIRFEAQDGQGRPVFTEHIGGLLRGVKCGGESRTTGNVPEIARYREKGRTPEWKRVLDIDPLFTYIYDGCSDIFFPIHTSEKFARSVGLPGIIVQGTATLALAVREITNAFAGADPSRIRTIACRFTDMVLPASSITVEADRAGSDQAAGQVLFRVINENGKKAISDGTVIIE